MRMVGWPSSGGTWMSVMPRHLLEHAADLDGDLAQRVEVGAGDLDGVLGIDAGGRLLDVVLDVLREGEGDAGEALAQRVAHLGDQLLLVEALAPFVGRLQRHEELDVGEAVGIGAVVGPAVLGDDGLDLGEALDQPAHAVDVDVALVERHRGRQRRAQPDVALLELGQEFQPDRAGGQGGAGHQDGADRERQAAMRQHAVDDAADRAGAARAR